ncbi:MAG: hypothetical protein E6J90_39005 [Deltaproteobacteria bacterium]|nr:MAG: hypothetical protein E6J90_39005 [Deltaproteobacteria bacterium]TMQ11451.1 MAG: hypothetical protein E6J91_22895 [Deltaproteobacteria bacterium]
MNDKEPIARLEHALEQLGAEHEPPRGWEARVLAAVEPKPRRRWWWLAVPALAVVLAVVLLPALLSPRPGALALTIERIPGPTRARGDTQVGDRIHATARGGAGHRAIWVYRGETDLVAVCPGGTGCSASGGALALDFALDRIGSYHVIALAGAAELPVPHGAYDEDLAAAMAAGATDQRQVIEVQ